MSLYNDAKKAATNSLRRNVTKKRGYENAANIVKGTLRGGLSSAVGNINKTIRSGIGSIQDIMKSNVNKGLQNLTSNITSGLPGELGNMANRVAGQLAGNITSKIDEFGNKIGNAVSGAMGDIAGKVGGVVGDAVNGINSVAGAIDSIGNAIGGIADNYNAASAIEDTGTEKQYLCKYKVKTFVIMKGEEKLEIDHSNILSIEYLNDYERNIMSMLKVSLRVDVRRRLWIIKNKNEIKVKFELVKIGLDIETEKEIISEETVWNEEFTPYFSTDDDYTDVQALEDRLEISDEKPGLDETETENYFETQNQMDLYLFQSKLLEASRYSFNRVYTKNTLQNMVAEMLTDSKHEKVLMSKFDNDEEYIEMLIPPMPLFKCLIYLDQYYGYYEKGALIFYDIDSLYILKTDGKITAKREEEWPRTNILVRELSASQPGQGMIRKEGEKVFYPTVSENEINPQKLSDAKNIELGDNTSIVRVDDIEVERKKGTLNPKNTTKNEFIQLIKKGTKYTSTVLQARVDENNCIIHCNGENFDINAFTPNKAYNVTFKETTKQERFGKNSYRLAYAYHFIKLESTEYMESSHKIVLKKTADPESNNNSDSNQ